MGWRLPDASSSRTRFERPRSLVATTTAVPSGVHSGEDGGPLPRGGRWSPMVVLPTSPSCAAVRFSVLPPRNTRRSDSVYDGSGLALIDPMNANALPSGDGATRVTGPSMSTTVLTAPPAEGTAYRLALPRS